MSFLQRQTKWNLAHFVSSLRLREEPPEPEFGSEMKISFRRLASWDSSVNIVTTLRDGYGGTVDRFPAVTKEFSPLQGLFFYQSWCLPSLLLKNTKTFFGGKPAGA